MSWLAHVLGLDNLSGYWYGFWSGIGGDLAIFGGASALLLRHNCHVRNCPRLGRHPVAGTPYVVCRRHHPEDAPTHGDVLTAHGEGATP